MSSPVPELPAYPDEAIRALSPAQLLSLIIGNEDRVPRNVIDECARRGEEMVQTLQPLVEDGRYWSDEAEPGEWWALLHSAMILGLIPGERSGLLLVQFMRRMADEEDENLQEWLADYWPALFRNKPASVFPALRVIAEDRSLDWDARFNAIEPIVYGSQALGPDALSAALAWIAGMAGNEEEDWDFRLFAAVPLLDFPQPEYRPLLDDLSRRQKRPDVVFTEDDVRDAYSEGRDRSQREHRDNPWREFYAPVAIERRQERWAEEEGGIEEEEEQVPGEVVLPYVRATAKTGRNDPCPCGSGRKYKRCCLLNEG